MTAKTKPLQLTGQIYIVSEADVDTDMIFHNRHLHITEREEMKQHMFGNLPSHQDFPLLVQPGNMLITGHNFGCGSSRQQAVDGFIALGLTVIAGESFGAIYKRNVINAGLPLIECPGILKSGVSTGDNITVDLETGKICHADGTLAIQGTPLGKVQQDLYFAGGLIELAKKDPAG